MKAASPATLPLGVNLPWLDYGCDFGATAWRPRGGMATRESQERLRAVLEEVAMSGALVVRWFLLCDGRAGVRVDGKGRARGLDEHVLADVEAALDLLARHGLRAMFVLTDFLWFRRRRVVDGVTLHGKCYLVAKPERQEELIDRVFTPLMERFGRDERIHSWDAFNEPEWAVFGLGSRDPSASLTSVRMRGYLGALVARVRGSARQPVTVGLASPRGLSLVRALDLDFYQWHWYDSAEAKTPLAQHVSVHQVDRPVLLGEFPTKGSLRSPVSIRQTAQAAGYAAAWAWSALADDSASERAVCLATFPFEAGVEEAPS